MYQIISYVKSNENRGCGRKESMNSDKMWLQIQENIKEVAAGKERNSIEF